MDSWVVRVDEEPIAERRDKDVSYVGILFVLRTELSQRKHTALLTPTIDEP